MLCVAHYHYDTNEQVSSSPSSSGSNSSFVKQMEDTRNSKTGKKYTKFDTFADSLPELYNELQNYMNISVRYEKTIENADRHYEISNIGKNQNKEKVVVKMHRLNEKQVIFYSTRVYEPTYFWSQLKMLGIKPYEDDATSVFLKIMISFLLEKDYNKMSELFKFKVEKMVTPSELCEVARSFKLNPNHNMTGNMAASIQDNIVLQ